MICFRSLEIKQQIENTPLPMRAAAAAPLGRKANPEGLVAAYNEWETLGSNSYPALVRRRGARVRSELWNLPRPGRVSPFICLPDASRACAPPITILTARIISSDI